MTVSAAPPTRAPRPGRGRSATTSATTPGPPTPRATTPDRATLAELDRRGVGGIFVYLPCWLGIAACTGVLRAAPALSALITLALLVLAVARYGLHRRHAAVVDRGPGLAHRLFLALLFGNGLLIGSVTGATLVTSTLAPAHEALVLVGGIVTSTSTMVLAIDPVIRRWMPVVILGPYTLGLLALPGTDKLSVLLVLVFMAYLHQASGRVHDDYWTAQTRGAELLDRAAQLQRLSETDPLTQVANRLHIDRLLHEEWTRFRRDGDELGLLLIDVDHFKRVNDDHGHPVGDLCLQLVAGALVGAAQREGELVARWGGEEFLVLLPHADRAGAQAVADRMRRAVAELTALVGSTDVQLTCSIGVVSVSAEWMAAHAPPAAVALADLALYTAKQSGRNRVELADT